MSTSSTRSPVARAAAVALVLALTAPAGAARATTVAARPSDDAAIVHVLNRLAYGPRPGDVEEVRRLGLERWIERQLHPERIDDSALEARLSHLRTVGLDSGELLSRYDLPRDARREIQRRRSEMGEDPTPQQRRALRREVMEKYGRDLDGTPRQVLGELQSAKLLRAAYSERQLDEVLVDFWMNHFNVFAGKGPLRFTVGEYERDVIRRHAWGRFEDLLKAIAESPSMLFYLDNWLSSAMRAGVDPARRTGGLTARSAISASTRRGLRPPDPPSGPLRMGVLRSPGQHTQGRKLGLNENYAREIMELHTLGVDGGYTQKDVTEVARCFTGWTITGLRRDQPRFRFEPRIHAGGDKTVLGRRIKAGGKDEGEQVIHLLATHPSTARLIATKLARRFVADEPPPALVERAAAVFRRTDGNIREVVRAIVASPEFLAPEARAAKVKTPFEFVVSAIRATGADVRDARELARRLGPMGMPLYLQQPPTGYKDVAEAWVSTSGLLARLNLALDLAAGRVAGVRVNAGSLTADRLVPAGLSEATRKTLAAEAGGAGAGRLAGLVLGSPEFQRR